MSPEFRNSVSPEFVPGIRKPFAGVEFTGQPQTYLYWDTQQANFFSKITIKSLVNDFTVIDLTGAGEAQMLQIFEHVYSLPAIQQSGIIYTGW